jgi:hypothetical protein
MSTVVLFLCHVRKSDAIAEWRRIQEAVKHTSDSMMLFHATSSLAAPLVGADVYEFTDESLARLPYTRFSKSIVPGSAHFPLLQFFRDYSRYDFYWLIEYDVRFSGDWNRLFDSFAHNNADFLSCHLRDHTDEPKWVWWELSHPSKHIPVAKRLRSFNPIYRISQTALLYLDQMHRDGWRGHFEALIPTLLSHGGFRLGDFGGSGRFALPENRNKFYLEGRQDRAGSLQGGTMRWRPVFLGLHSTSAIWVPNMLFHPVKSTFE